MNNIIKEIISIIKQGIYSIGVMLGILCFSTMMRGDFNVEINYLLSGVGYLLIIYCVDKLIKIK